MRATLVSPDGSEIAGTTLEGLHLIYRADGEGTPRAIEGALPALGWTNVAQVRVGKYVRLELESSDRDAAAAQVQEMAKRLLSNPVIETFAIRDVSEHVGVHEEQPA
mgnify:CR=1 FL=1